MENIMAIKLRKKSKKEREDLKRKLKEREEILANPERYRSSFPGGVRTKLHSAELKQMKHSDKLGTKAIKKGWSGERLKEARGGKQYKEGKLEYVRPKNIKARLLAKKTEKLRGSSKGQEHSREYIKQDKKRQKNRRVR